MFVLVLRRQASDYKQVIKRIDSTLKGKVAVKEMISGFERTTFLSDFLG